MSEPVALVGRGFCYEDLRVGFRFRTHRRTVTEADLAAFVNLSWLTEELFAVQEGEMSDAGRAIKGRAVPAALPSPKACCCRPCRTPGSPSSTRRSM